MVTILEPREPRESDESSSSSGAKRPTMASLIVETVKSDCSEDASTTIHTPSTPPTERNQVGNKLLRKFISTMSKKPPTTDEDKEADLPIWNVDTPMSPPPFIRPLEYKLIPRQEPRFRPHGPGVKGRNPADSTPITYVESMSQSSSLASISTQEIARNRERAALILNGELELEEPEITDLEIGNANYSLNYGDPSGYQSEYRGGKQTADVTLRSEVDQYQDGIEACEAKKEKYGVDSLQYKIAKYHEKIAISVAQDDDHIPLWREYLGCYTKGSYNLIKPPCPPPYQKGFVYLPAMFPPDEIKRISLCEPLVQAWDEGILRATGDFVCLAMDIFGCSFASLSWFDHGRELFHAERGYQKSSISRSISIAAHALLSHDVLVVLDAKEDWRFCGNPLVQDEGPKIRFFAGAPMLSHDGLAVGVFSLFSPQPRKSFSPDQRRQLADLASQALKSLAAGLDTLDRRSTPVLQRLSIINGVFHPVASVPSFQMKKRQYISVAPNHDTRTRGNDAQTPPPTASDDGWNWNNSSGNFGNQSSQYSGSNTFPSLQNLITPISREYDEYSPRYSARPFSSSDITSLHMIPPNTPDNSLIDEPLEDVLEGRRLEVTVEDFLSLSDEDCTEDPAYNLSAKDTPNMPSSPLIDFSSPVNQTVQYRNSPELESRNIATIRTNSPRPRTEPFSAVISAHSQASDRSNAGLINACHSLAKYGFDLVYAVEVYPRRPNMSDKELLAPGGLALRVLAEYGRSQPLNLSPSIHLQALRARGGLAYGIEGFPSKDQELEVGYLIPVDTQPGPLRLRSGGVVLGAFRKHEHNGAVGNLSAKEEGERLRMAVDKIKSVFLKGTQFQSVLNLLDSNPYPANEAVEFGKYSLDTSMIYHSSGSQGYSSRINSRVNVSRPETRLTRHEHAEVKQGIRQKYTPKFVGFGSTSTSTITATHKRRRHFG